VSQPSSLTITLSPAQATAADEPMLILEQEPWRAASGYITLANMVREVAATLYGEDALGATQVNCDRDGLNVYADIYAYPRDVFVQYQILTSHGHLAGGAIQTPLMDEILQFQLDTEQQVKYPVQEIASLTWLTAYDQDGNPLVAPDVLVVGRTVTSSAPVYGSLRIRYTTRRYMHTLTMAPRPDAEENWYSAVIMGLPADGEPVFLTFEPPPTAEELYSRDEECGGGGGSVLDDPERGGNPVSQGTLVQIYNYCTGKLVREY
jgi:hypothetical protein